jgi:hypothetical protein
MSRGDSLIISKSKLKPEYRDIFLTAKFFSEKPGFDDMSAWTNWFDPANAKGAIEQTILDFLDEQSYDYSDNQIEYWFQDFIDVGRLDPHCDYNHKVRGFGMDAGEWLHTADKHMIMSPVTIGIYLEVSNLKGGDLIIHHHEWFNEPTPLFLDEHAQKRIAEAPKENYTPQQDDVIYFEGSRYYHSIEPMESGTRKSMMINFWPREYVVINT